MQIRIPDDLPIDAAEAYRRGATDCLRAFARAGGSAKSEAKTRAAQLNAKRGGRKPNKQKPNTVRSEVPEPNRHAVEPNRQQNPTGATEQQPRELTYGPADE